MKLLAYVQVLLYAVCMRISADTQSTSVQIRYMDVGLKRQLLHECIDRGVNMATLVQAMWLAYRHVKYGEPIDGRTPELAAR